MDWNSLRERVLTIPALENKSSQLTIQINKAESEAAAAQRKHKKEALDVERMEKETLSAFLLKLVGKYEDKLEKEQQEEIRAKLEYDNAVTNLEFLKSERREVGERISQLRKDENNYKIELNARRQSLFSKSSNPQQEAYAEIESTITKILTQQTEIREAQTAAARAKTTAERALGSLKSAKSWATVDVFTKGGIITHMAKYSHIDDAESDLNILSSRLKELRVELNNIRGIEVGKLSGIQEISSTQRAVDFWFDNIFTDLSVRRKVANNADEVEKLVGNLRHIQRTLESRLTELDRELTLTKNREEEFLLSLNPA